MKQSNALDLLGANDPRSTSIGIIYVSPTDDRKSVLAAIITQEKLGRKQVAVVLPNQNKAFQRPVDFDDLKSMRRKLQTQIVFIAPSGPGPAEFARQRRFPVYSTLESYAKALRDEEGSNTSGKKPSWFGSGKPKTVDRSQINENVQPRPASSPPVDGGKNKTDNSVASFATGMAAGALAGGGAALIADHGHNQPAGLSDDGDILPPANPFNIDSHDHDLNETGEADSAGGPKAIELPTQRKTTGVLSSPSASHTPTGAIIPPIPSDPMAQRTPPDPMVLADAQAGSGTPTGRASKSSSGKIAAAGLGATLGSAGSQPRIVSGSTVPPMRANPGGGSNNPRRRNNRFLLIGVILVIVTLLIACAGTAYAQPVLFKQMTSMIPGFSQPATITITPSSKIVSNSYVVTGVTGNADPAKRQVAVRPLTASASSPAKTVTATGVEKTPGIPSQGTLTFFNGSNSIQSVAANTLITSSSGISVVTDSLLIIPAANPPNFGIRSVSAHSTRGGAASNIAALDISQSCCVAGNFITVKNQTAFTGGHDPQSFTVLQQSDIDNAVNSVENQLTQQATASLQNQVHSSEQLAGTVQCKPIVNANHNAGERVANATVGVSVNCNGQAYDHQGAQDMLKNLLQNMANTDPGPGYTLVGNVQTQITVQSAGQNNVSLLATGKGIWAYKFDNAQKQALAKLIAGKKVSVVQNLLKSQKMIGNATFQVNGDTLPADAGQISIVVQDVPGLQGDGTPPIAPTITGTGPVNTQSGTNGKG